MRKISETCYLDKVGLGKFNPDTFTNPYATNPNEYKDPDNCCDELYHDLEVIYKNKFNIKGFELSKCRIKEDRIWLWLDDKNRENSYTMTSDFIGPSRAHARDVGILGKDVGEYLRNTRIIGGHMLWPAQYWINNRKEQVLKGNDEIGTINTQRGNNGFCDRIDCTLHDLKNYYIYKNEKTLDKPRLFAAFDKYDEWLTIFGDFPGFVNFFFLNDFCDEDYNVWDLKTYNSKNNKFEKTIDDKTYKNLDFYKISDEEEYKAFISGSVKVISARQSRIVDEVKDNDCVLQ